MNEINFYIILVFIFTIGMAYFNGFKKSFGDFVGYIIIGMLCPIIVLTIGSNLPQHEIKTVVDIKYNTLNISDDGLYLFVVTDNSKTVVRDFTIELVDESNPKVGKLIKTTVKSDESKFPNNIFDSSEVESETYVYYAKLTK